MRERIVFIERTNGSCHEIQLLLKKFNCKTNTRNVCHNVKLHESINFYSQTSKSLYYKQNCPLVERIDFDIRDTVQLNLNAHTIFEHK